MHILAFINLTLALLNPDIPYLCKQSLFAKTGYIWVQQLASEEAK